MDFKVNSLSRQEGFAIRRAALASSGEVISNQMQLATSGIRIILHGP
jgi:hypothetical protein